MNKNTIPTQAKLGRPATGKTKIFVGVTIDKMILAKAKSKALSQRISTSQFFERAVETSMKTPKK